MKYQNEHDEFVSANVEDNDGNVEAPTGWFGRLDLRDRDVIEARHIEHYGSPYVLISESNEGFVTVLPFEDKDKRDARFKELVQAYALYLAEVEPREAMAAILGYRAAAVWIAAPDAEAPPGITENSQRLIREDVLQYLAENADELRTYVETIGVDWSRAGHEFYLARNGHPAFSDHAGGPVVDALMESARAYGPQALVVGDDGELEVQ